MSTRDLTDFASDILNITKEYSDKLIPSNVVQVDYTRSYNIKGKIYKTYAEAVAYATPIASLTNRITIILPNGVVSENIELKNYINVEGRNTVLTGVISTSIFGTGLELSKAPLHTYIMNCTITKLNLNKTTSNTNVNYLLAKHCTFKDVTQGTFTVHNNLPCGLIITSDSLITNCNFRSATNDKIYLSITNGNVQNSTLSGSLLNGAGSIGYDPLTQCTSCVISGCNLYGGNYQNCTFVKYNDTNNVLRLNSWYDIANSNLSNTDFIVNSSGSTNTTVSIHNSVVNSSCTVYYKYIISQVINFANCDFWNPKFWRLTSLTLGTNKLLKIQNCSGDINLTTPTGSTQDPEGAAYSSYSLIPMSNINYKGVLIDNSSNGLTSTDLQGAINELANNISSGTGSGTVSSHVQDEILIL